VSSPHAGNAVLTDVVDGVLVVTINRPDARNAINTETAVAIGAAMDRLDDDGTLVAGVITGAGGTFCAGMDLKAFLAGERPSIPGRGFAGIVEQPPVKPVIAAIEGYAIAGGFEIALACDMLVAAEDAKFGLPEVKRGLVAAGGGLVRLPRQAPLRIALEMALTGDIYDAETLQRMGMINRLTEEGGALAAAIELGERIAANAPLALAVTKKVIRQSLDWPNSQSYDLQREFTSPVFQTNDAKEGATAFAQKRAPKWTGT